jgi:hypothetical protein
MSPKGKFVLIGGGGPTLARGPLAGPEALVLSRFVSQDMGMFRQP